MSDFAVELHMPAELSSELQRHSGLLAFVREAYPVVDSPEIADLAAMQRKDCLTVVAQIKVEKGKFVEPAKAIIAQAEALFDGPMDNAKAAADYCGSLLLVWDASEKARVAEENRIAEVAAAKMRAEAEAKAAAIRAKAEAEAREAARKAQEAALAIAKANAEGNAKEAAAASARAAKQASEDAARAEAARIKAAQIEAETAARVAAIPVAEVENVVGFGARANWKSEFAPGYNTEQDVLLALVEAIGKGRTELVALLALDTSACNKAARAYKQNWNVPGLRAVNKPVGTTRGG